MDEILDFETSSNVAPPTGEATAPSAGEGDTALSQPVSEDTTSAVEASEETEQAPAKTRDRRGRYRSSSSEAAARIAELTKKASAAEARAKELEAKVSTPAPVPQQAPAPQPIPQQAQPVQQQLQPQPGQTFPAFAAWITQEGNSDKSYEDYADARADWRFELQRTQEKQRQEFEHAQKTFQERVQSYETQKTAARAKYADFDTVMASPVAMLPMSVVMQAAILGSTKGAEIAYHLASHPELHQQLIQETAQAHPSAEAPLRRFLDSLIPDAPPARNVAAPTGSALALVPPSVPKPPNPVRTGAMKSGDELPGDDSSLEEHERAFGRPRRSRRR